MTKKYLILIFVLLLSIDICAQPWRPISGSRQANISGMALISHDKRSTAVLVVHDNKKKEQAHATIITITGSDSPLYTPLKWQGDDIPVDIEAAASVPERGGQFIVFTAVGRAYHIKVDLRSATVEVIRSFDVPRIPKDADFEGFDLQKVNGTLLAVWAERGATAKPATIFSARFDLADYKFSDTTSEPFRVPYPLIDVRHVSDIKVDTTGAVFVTAASDPGNDGPFSSALYYAGVITMAADGSFVFARPATFTPLFRFAYHKVEAFDFVPGSDGGLVFGTDDENLGAALLTTF